jgi:pilus assembly protein CpaB
VTARRRRGLLLLSVALASGGLAASQVHEREQEAAEELGPSVEVLVAARDLEAGARVTPDEVGVRRLPARFAPPDAFASAPGTVGRARSPAAAAGLVGARVSVPVAAGSYLNAALFEGGEERRDPTTRGERAVTVGVAGSHAGGDLVPGTRVDVLVSTEPGPGGGRTVMALAGAELVRLSAPLGEGYPAGGPGPEDSAAAASPEPTELATLRVSLRQAIYLTAADNFAREIRLLARPPGDPSRAGGRISQSQL